MKYVLAKETIASIRDLAPGGSQLQLILRRGDPAELWRYLTEARNTLSELNEVIYESNGKDKEYVANEKLVRAITKILHGLNNAAGRRGKNYLDNFPPEIGQNLKDIFSRLDEFGIGVRMLKLLVAEENFSGAIEHINWIVEERSNSSQNLEALAKKFKRLMFDKRINNKYLEFTDRREETLEIGEIKEVKEKPKPTKTGLSWQAMLGYGAAITAAGGLATALVKNQSVEAEKAKYGNVYPLRQQLAEAMIEKADNGQNMFEYFLPLLKHNGNRFVVNVCMVTPPATSALGLAEIPAAWQERVISGLNCWKDYFEFKIVTEPKQADLLIYMENKLLARTNLLGISPHYQKANPLFAFAETDVKKLGNFVLLNQAKLSSGSRYLEIDRIVAHEFGHRAGIGHPEAAIVYQIRHNAGFEDWRKVPDNLHIEWMKAVGQEFPKLSDLTIMCVTSVWPVAPRLGELDKRAMEIILTRSKDPNPKSSTDSRGR